MDGHPADPRPGNPEDAWDGKTSIVWPVPAPWLRSSAQPHELTYHETALFF